MKRKGGSFLNRFRRGGLQDPYFSGYLHGPSHEQGGIPVNVKNGPPIEVEGGEIIINRETVKALGAEFFLKLNQTATPYHPAESGFSPGQLVVNGVPIYRNGGIVRQYPNGGQIISVHLLNEDVLNYIRNKLGSADQSDPQDVREKLTEVRSAIQAYLGGINWGHQETRRGGGRIKKRGGGAPVGGRSKINIDASLPKPGLHRKNRVNFYTDTKHLPTHDMSGHLLCPHGQIMRDGYCRNKGDL